MTSLDEKIAEEMRGQLKPLPADFYQDLIPIRDSQATKNLRG